MRANTLALALVLLPGRAGAQCYSGCPSTLTTDSLPPVCAAVPAADTFGGSVGIAGACIPRADAARPTQVQPSTALTASDGSFAGTWRTSFPAVPTTAIASAQSVANPYICQVSTLTVTGYAGKCWQIISNTLPGVATALPGLVVSSYASPAAGLTVMVVGRQ